MVITTMAMDQSWIQFPANSPGCLPCCPGERLELKAGEFEGLPLSHGPGLCLSFQRLRLQLVIRLFRSAVGGQICAIH